MPAPRVPSTTLWHARRQVHSRQLLAAPGEERELRPSPKRAIELMQSPLVRMHNFDCSRPEGFSPGIHAEQFRCVTQWTNNDTIVVTQTDFIQNTQAVQTRTRQTNQHLAALAVLYVSPVSLRTPL